MTHLQWVFRASEYSVGIVQATDEAHINGSKTEKSEENCTPIALF
jgi:hypothetical protein